MDTAQPDINYMCQLASIIRNAKCAKSTLIKLRNTPGHSWCNDILRNLDSTLSEFQSLPTLLEHIEYSNSLYKYLCELRDIFKRGAWFKKESHKFSKEMAFSFQTIFETFPNLIANCNE